MRWLEVRRHSLRKAGGGSQLSQAGVDLARRVGATVGPFAMVATSVSPRARETAIAMGFAVDQELVPLVGEDAPAAEMEAMKWDQARRSPSRRWPGSSAPAARATPSGRRSTRSGATS